MNVSSPFGLEHLRDGNPEPVVGSVNAELAQRMYVLVHRSLSQIQRGIQAAHAVVEYALIHGETPQYQRWANTDKTLIVLNGGIPVTHLQSLINNDVPITPFSEPDLAGTVTAIALLADERVWNRTLVPDFVDISPMDGVPRPYAYPRQYLDFIGGRTNRFLREFLSTFKTA